MGAEWCDDVHQAIREADALLPGEPVEKGEDPRWQAIIEVGEYVESEPEAVWGFIQRWGGHPQEDLRDAVATCLLEHLLSHHFAAYFARVEKSAMAEPLFGDMFQRCWRLGQADEPGNAERFESLISYSGCGKGIEHDEALHGTGHAPATERAMGWIAITESAVRLCAAELARGHPFVIFLTRARAHLASSPSRGGSDGSW